MGDLSELETKTHLYVYINNQVGNASITNPFSLPFHQDNGLFLMLTPPTSFPLSSRTSRADPSSPIVSDLTPSCSWSAVASLTGFSRMLSTACSPLHTPSHP